MATSLKDDLVRQEKVENSNLFQSTNQGKNRSDDDNANVKPSFHSSAMKHSEFFKKAEHVELSNPEESNVESDTAEISTDSPVPEFFSKNPSIPKYLINYIEGMGVCGDSYSPIDLKPDWLDIDKFRKGQKVAMKYHLGIQFAQLLSLMAIANLPGGLESLQFTGNSDVPFKAFKRYLSTALIVRTWYLDDLWNSQTKGHKNLKKVRAMHEYLRKNLTVTGPGEHGKRCDSGCPALWSTLHNKIREDFEETCPKSGIFKNEILNLCKTRVSVSQTEMIITQFGFAGLFIMRPAHLGAHGITEDELDNFIHLWRCIGYLLGMEDKYNLCNGSLKIVREKINDIIELLAKPNLRLVTQEWEHMMRCITEGVSYFIPLISFEVSLLYLCNMFGLHMPRLWTASSLKQKIIYMFVHFTFWFILRLPGTLAGCNRLLDKVLNYAENASPSTLKRWKEKKYPYQEN